MERRYFSISRKQGKFYLKSKEPKEGYEEVTYADNKKTYHKYFTSVKGLPKRFMIQEAKFDNKTMEFLTIVLEDKEGGYENFVSTNLNSLATYTEEARKLVSVFENYQPGEPIILTIRKGKYTDKKGEERDTLEIYGNYLDILDDSGRGQSTGFIPYNEIPRAIERKVANKSMWDWIPVTEFFYKKILEIGHKIKEFADGIENKETPEVLGDPKEVFKPETAEVSNQSINSEIKENDLPF